MAEHKTLAEALAAFQSNLPHVDKGSVNPHFKSAYSPLEDIVKVVLPALAAQGLTWMTMPTMDGSEFVLKYELRHVGGESVGGAYPLVGGNDQQRGSSISYAKRYALCAVTGVTPGGDDDDGNAATKSKPATQEPPKPRVLTGAEWAVWAEKLDACESADEVRGVWQEAQKAGLLAAITPMEAPVGATIQRRAGELQ